MIVNEDNLKNIIDSLKNKFLNKDLDFYTFGLSIETIRLIMGNDWTNQAIFKDHPVRGKSVDAYVYLKSDNIGYKWQHRVHRLAEMLYNLQEVPGFLRIIDEIKSGNFVSRFAELDAAAYLYKRDLAIRFVDQSGIKGFDYDIEINENNKISCEVKHKIETTNLSKKTIEKVLSNANKQVPSNQPSIFFIKVPEQWIKDQNFKMIMDKLSEDFLKRHGNILGIVIRWEIADEKYDNIDYWMYYFFRNNYSVTDSYNDALLKKLENAGFKWFNLMTFTSSYL